MDLDRYRTGYHALYALIDTLDPERIGYKPGADRWSIHEILVHLADAEAQSYIRIRSILADNDARIMNHDEHAWSVKLRYGDVLMARARSLIDVVRETTAPLLASLGEEEWNRSGFHSVRGRVLLRDLVTGSMDHVDQHLAQIERNLKHFDQHQVASDESR